MHNFKKLFILLILVVFFDQTTKFFASVLNFKIYYNSGISLSFLETSDPNILTLSLMLLTIFLFFNFKKVWIKNQVAAGLFLGGAVSNILDRIYFGSVRDWILLPPTQIKNNFADISIFVGLFLLMFTFINSKKVD